MEQTNKANYEAVISKVNLEQTDIEEKFNKAFKDREYSHKKILEESRKDKDFVINYDSEDNEVLNFFPKMMKVIGIMSSEEEDVINNQGNGLERNNVQKLKEKEVLSPNGGMRFEIGDIILEQMKNYFLPNILKLFQNINFSIDYKANLIKISQINIQIPLHLLHEVKENIKLTLDPQNQNIIISLIKLPLYINLKSEITNVFGEDFKGIIKIITEINLIEIKLSFQKNKKQNFFKPKILLKLSHWDIKSSKMNITTDIEKLPSLILDLIADVFTKKILNNIKETLKNLLPKKISDIVNEKIENHLNDFFPIGKEKSKLALNILCTKNPIINKKSISYFISGEFFYSDDESYVPGTFLNEPINILNFDENFTNVDLIKKITKKKNINDITKKDNIEEKKIFDLKTEEELNHIEIIQKIYDKNFDLSLTENCLLNFLHLYMGNLKHNTFKIKIAYVEYKLRLDLSSSSIKLENQSILIKKVKIKFFKEILNSEIGGGIIINLKGKLKSIDLQNGLAEIEYEKAIFYKKEKDEEKDNNDEKEKIENIFEQKNKNDLKNQIISFVLSSKIIPSVFKFKPLKLPFGIKLGLVESVFYKGIHFMSKVDIEEIDFKNLVKEFLLEKVLDDKKIDKVLI